MSKLTLGHWTPAYRGQMRCEIRNQSLLDCLALNTNGILYRSWETVGSNIARLRNEALQRAIELELDFLVMQDADVVPIARSPEESALLKLVTLAHESGAVATAAVCALRRGDGAEMNVHPLHTQEHYECELVGAGLLCINVQRLCVLGQGYTGPWFANVHEDERQTVLKHGEDLFFCKLVRGLGGTIYVDATIATDHDGRTYTP